MLEVRNVSKKFIKKVSKRDKVSFYADQDISFEANKGEVLGILGPNGAGKTTLLRMLSGIMEPSSGEIFFDGLSYQNDGILIKKKIAFLSGNTKLYKDISPIELLRMCGDYYGVEKSILEERIQNIVKRFAMEEFLYQRIENLSTGQYQRVSIARCLVIDPDYYILDEATSGLDVISSQVIIDFILEEKQRGKCILYSTHYMEEAQNICDRILMLHHGKVIASGGVEEVLSKTGKDNLRSAFFAFIEEDSGK